MKIDEAIAKAKLEAMKALYLYEQRTIKDLIEAGCNIDDVKRILDRNRPEIITNMENKLGEVRSWLLRDGAALQ